MSGLQSLWPNLPLQSEESDLTTMKVEPISSELDTEISEMLSAGDDPVPIGMQGSPVDLWITHTYKDCLSFPDYTVVIISRSMRNTIRPSQLNYICFTDASGYLFVKIFKKQPTTTHSIPL